MFSDGQVGGFEEAGMTYPDFIFFMLSEEDKSSHCALRYWYVICVRFVLVVWGMCASMCVNVMCARVVSI